MTSPVDTSVKFFTDDMTGAPTLTGVAGALVSLFDALLVNGWGMQTATSVVVASGVATVTLPAAFPAHVHSVILLAGATPSGLNGEQKVVSLGTNIVRFATAEADGTATGTITVKMAPLGWAKTYSGTNKAVYKPTDVAATSALLRVDDTGTTAARVRMFETMSDVDTGTNPAPTDAKMSGGMYWWKSSTANATTRKYTIFGDSRNLYVGVDPYSVGVNVIHAFGDLDSYKSGDAYCGFIIGDSAVPGVGSLGSVAQQDPQNNETMQIMRSHTGLGAAVTSSRKALTGASGQASGNDSWLGNFPAPANNGLFLSRMVGFQRPLTSSGPRGLIPGVFYVPQAVTNGSLFPRGTVIDGTGDYAGRKIYAVPQAIASISTATSDYAFFFDVTGPWRA